MQLLESGNEFTMGLSIGKGLRCQETEIVRPSGFDDSQGIWRSVEGN